MLNNFPCYFSFRGGINPFPSLCNHILFYSSVLGSGIAFLNPWCPLNPALILTFSHSLCRTINCRALVVFHVFVAFLSAPCTVQCNCRPVNKCLLNECIKPHDQSSDLELSTMF
ncbi:unnamed protein product [Rangifer tarandus platyrhynchus]|uniref:Uncharacterized protein n=1 Tax=Rangifer tarandus platyrhynchus TaxID=3082113 RepID=A0AC59YB65_RANTA